MAAIARQILPAAADGGEEWKKQRTQGFGGSNASELHTGKKSRFELWREKTGLAPEEYISPELQALFDYGHSREPELARIFRDRTGTRVRNTGTWARKDAPWMLANPDRLVGSDGILEIKTTGAYTDAAKLWREGLVPPHAWIQAHWYAHVTGRRVLWFIAEVDRQPIILGPYNADPDLLDDLDLEAREFWALVEGEAEPTAEDEEVAAPVVIVDGLTKPLDPWDDTVADLARLLDLKDQAKALTAEIKDLEASIQAKMGEAEFLTSADGEVIYATNRVGSRASLDQDAMKADGIDVDAYKITKPNSKPTLNVKKEARA